MQFGFDGDELHWRVVAVNAQKRLMSLYLLNEREREKGEQGWGAGVRGFDEHGCWRLRASAGVCGPEACGPVPDGCTGGGDRTLRPFRNSGADRRALPRRPAGPSGPSRRSCASRCEAPGLAECDLLTGTMIRAGRNRGVSAAVGEGRPAHGRRQQGRCCGRGIGNAHLHVLAILPCALRPDRRVTGGEPADGGGEGWPGRGGPGASPVITGSPQVMPQVIPEVMPQVGRPRQ